MAQKNSAFNQYKSDIPHLVNIIKTFNDKTPTLIVEANKTELKKIYDNAELSKKEQQIIESVLGDSIKIVTVKE